MPQTTELFAKHSVDVSLFGVKQCPNITMAFDRMMERKNELLLTVKSTTTIFAYLCKIYQWDESFNQKVSKIDFIPVKGLFIVGETLCKSVCVLCRLLHR